QLAAVHLSELKERISGLESIANVLSQLMMHCQGDDRPECPILESLAGEDTTQEFIEARGTSHPHVRIRRSSPEQ
ncbi:MAG: Cu(I)-responsive transcriptional regulator, partial [Nitrosomonas sp.]|nr:Cu(I)-responsive transcriptional regulator [Nitrosomonas sp.]